jgi:site-specific DNA-methyltransferase (adenine-specific)
MKAPSTTRTDWNDPQFRRELARHCRLAPGDLWRDDERGHLVACGDACNGELVAYLAQDGQPTLAIQDPPYNLAVGPKYDTDQYVDWCRKWMLATGGTIKNDAALYVWLGADQTDHFQPLPQFMAMMADSGWRSRSLITLRNQRGYGTQGNWMAVRQELLYYTRGNPAFEVQYTDIPKAVRGYYKNVGGEMTENLQRSRSDCIRPGNVWMDIQQVFYRMQENVEGCPAQKPLAAIERIIAASSQPGDTVMDLFAHSGTTLLACERLGRRCVTMDVDPIYAELTIRRLEHFRQTGLTGWQRQNPFGAL